MRNIRKHEERNVEDDGQKDNIDTISRSTIDKLAQKYDTTWWPRAIVSAFPCIGGSIDAAISSRAQEVVQARLERMFTFLFEEVERLDMELIDKQYFLSDEGIDLLRMALEKSIRIRQKEHLRAIARILIAAMWAQPRATGYWENAIGVLSELREDEAFLLGGFFRLQPTRDVESDSQDGGEGPVMTIDVLEQEIPLPDGRLPFALKRLEALGLVEEMLINYPGRVGGRFKLTDFGRGICILVDDDCWVDKMTSQNYTSDQ